MSKVVIWSDLHLGHKNIHKYRTEFISQRDHRESILKVLTEVVNKRDSLILLGDIHFDEQSLEDIANIKCVKKTLVLGNHDTEKYSPKLSDLCEVYNEIHSLLRKGRFWLSHCPVHPDELRGRRNIHGHCHGHRVEDERYINVCPEQTDYKPLILQEIK